MTNPTPEQIEAAAVALCNSRRAHLGLSPIDRLPWSKDAPKYRAEASAALVAAAGAAPQELSDKDSEALKAAAQPYAHRFQRGADLGLYVQIRHLPGIVAEWLRGGGR